MTSAGALERQRRRILVRAATWQWALRSYYARNAYVLGINVYTLIVTLALARNIVHVRRQTLSRSSSSIRHASLTILAATRRSEQCASPASPHHHATCPRGSLLILGTGCPLSSRGPSLRTWLRETRCCLASPRREHRASAIARTARTGALQATGSARTHSYCRHMSVGWRMKVGRPHRALWPSSLRVEQMPWRSSRANSTMALQRDAWRYGHATKTTTQRHCMGGCGALSALGVVDTELEPVARLLRSDVRWCALAALERASRWAALFHVDAQGHWVTHSQIDAPAFRSCARTLICFVL